MIDGYLSNMRAFDDVGDGKGRAPIRKEAAPAYPSADCAELRPEVLGRATHPDADKTE